METYQEWKKRRTEEGTIGQRTTAPSSSWSSKKRTETGVETYTAWKERRAAEGTLPDYKRRLFENTAYNRQNQLFDYLDRASAFYKSAEDDFDSTTWGNAADRFKTRRTDALNLRDEGLQLQRWMQENKDYLDPETYDQVYSDLVDINDGYMDVVSSFRSNADFYSQFDTEEDYLKWDAYSTTEKRQATYQQNLESLDELTKRRDELKPSEDQPGNPYTTGGGPARTGMPYGAGNLYLNPVAEPGPAKTRDSSAADTPYGAMLQYREEEQKTPEQLKLEEIEREIARLELDINNYKRGNTVDGFYYGYKKADDYSAYLSDPNYGKYSASDFSNPTTEDLEYYDAMMDQSTWYQDGSGKTYNRLGELVTENVYSDDPRYQIADPLGMYLQATPEERANLHGDGSSQIGVLNKLYRDGTYGNWEQLTQDEVGIYYTILGSQGQDAALKYLSDMQVELNRRGMYAQDELYKQAFDAANGWQRLGMSALSVPANLLGGAAGFLDDLSHTIKGEEINPYSAAHGLGNYSQQIRKHQAAAFDESSSWELPWIKFSAGDLYQAVMSTADMAGGALLGPTTYGALMGMGAATTEARRLYEMGASSDQIALGAGLAGAAEMVFERYSMDKLIHLKDADTLRKLVTNALVQGGIEASEEGATEIANLLTNNIIMTSESDWAKLLEEHNGSEYQAFIAAAGRVGSASMAGFVAGFLGGGGGSFGSYTNNYYNDAKTGQAINDAEGLAKLQEIANDQAKKRSEMAQTDRTAKREQRELNKWSENANKNHKRLNELRRNRATGMLYKAVQQSVDSDNVADIASALREQGISEKKAKAIAQAFYNQVTEQGVTPQQAQLIREYGEDSKVQKVIADKLFDIESTIFQRNKALREFEFDVITNQIRQQNAEQTGDDAENTSETTEDLDDTYEFSEDGKAHLKSAPDQAVDIVGFESINNGKVRLRTSDGQVVDASDVLHASEADAIVFETIANMGIKASSANKLLEGFRENQGADAEAYARGLLEAFEYGKQNQNTSGMSFSSALTPAQLDYVYRQGRKAAGKQVAKEQSAIRKKEKTSNGEKRTGTVHFDRKGRTFDSVRETSLKTLDKLAAFLGNDVYIYESYENESGDRVYLDDQGNEVEAPNGFYDPSDGSIHIDLNAGQDGKGIILFTASHELVHFIRQWSPAKFKVLANFLVEQYHKKGASVSDLIQQQKDKAKQNGRQITTEEAFEEMVADSMETMLTDGNVVQMMAELKQRDKTLWQKICDWFRDLVADLQQMVDAYKGVKPETAEGRMVADMKDAIAVFQSLYVDALDDASESFRTTKNTTGDGGVKMQPRQNGFMNSPEIQTVQNIGRRSIFDLPYKDLVKLEKFAKTYWNTMNVKSPFFRSWFGDWRLNDHKTRVNVARKRGDTTGSCTNIDTDWTINISGHVFSETKNHVDSYNIAARKYLPYIRDIVEKAILLDTHGMDPQKIKSENSLLMHSLYAIADIGKGPEVLKLYVEEMNNPNRSGTDKRAYQLQNIEKYRPAARGSQNNASPISAAPTGIGYTVSDLAQYVKSKDADYSPQYPSKIVNADGSPKIMYHGSHAQFTVFDRKKSKSSGLYGTGFYFTDSDTHAGTYGNLYKVYLNVRNPLKAGEKKISKAQVRKFLEAVAENEDYSIENYGTYDIDSILRDVMGGKTTADAFRVIQDVSATAIGNMVEAAELFNSVNGTEFDGIIVPTETVVFRPEQIKSATDNIGTFDGSNPDIRYSARKKAEKDVNAAIQKENAQLREDIKQLKELLKLQRTVTGGTKFTRSSVESMAKILMQSNNAKGDRVELANLLNDLYEYIATEKDLTWEDVAEKAQPTVDWIRKHTVFKKERSQYATEILNTVRTSRIALSETQKGEAAYRFGSVNDYRKSMMGSVVIANDGVPLDIQWQEWSTTYPDIFDAEITAADMPGALADVIASLRNSDLSMTEFAYHADMIEQDLLRQVYDGFWRVSTLRTVADVKQREINELKSKHYQKMNDLRQKHQEASEKMKEAQRERLKKLRQEYRDSADKRILRNKIKHVVGELDHMLRTDSKKKHVPDSLKKAVAEALAIENMDTVQADAKIAKYESLIANETDQNKIDAYMLAIERLRKSGNRLKELRDAYEEIRQSTDPDIAMSYDPDLAGHLNEVTQTIGNTSLNKMSVEQLSDLYDMYRAVLTRVRDSNKMHEKNIKEQSAKLSNDVISEVRAEGTHNRRSTKIREAFASFSWNNEKPVYAFERLGSKTLSKLYWNIRKGMDTWAVDMMEADEFRRSMYDKYHRKGWDMDKLYKFQSSTGLEFSLNLEQIMSLYAYSKRAQAHDHLLKGGIVFDADTKITEIKNGIRRTYLVDDATTYKISDETLADIVATLNTDQKAFVDEMQNYLSTTMGNKGNQVSMKMYGIKLFKEQYYFPLRSAGQFTERAREADLRREQGQTSLSNSGFTHSTVQNASNPVILSTFMDAWSSHVNDMSNYHAFVLPLDDFRRVYNYKTANIEGQDSVSVYQAIQNAHGKAATAYIDQLYRDLNGGVVADPRENIAKKMIGLFKQGAVMASASVVIQQPSSIARAFAIIDPKYFGVLPITRGAGRLLTDKVHHQHQQLWEELKKFAPVAMIKQMGYFDTGMGRSAVDFLQTEEYHGFGEKAKGFFTDSDYRRDVLSKAAAKADELTWIQIWNAVKNETADRNPGMNRNSEEFLKIAGERFSEVIDRTQVYDSVFARSGNMRSKSVFMNIATAFMAEPTTSINMIEDAIRKWGKGYKRHAARTIVAVFLNVLLNSALVSLVYAGRDDDEDETYLEKYVSSFVTESMDGLNPMTYYPFLKDVWSILQGYDVERADMSLVTDVVDVMKNLVKLNRKDTSDMDEEELAEHNKQIRDEWLKALDGMTAFMGLPVKNVRRDFNGAINMYKTLSADFGGRTTTIRSLGDVLQSDVSRTIPVLGWLPQEKKEDKLFDALVAGDTAYVERLKSTYKDEKAYQSAIRSVIGDRFVKGKIGANKASRYLVLYGGLDASQARGYIEKWTMKIDVGVAYDDLRKQYVDNEVTESEAVDYLVKYGGKKRNDAEETVNKWRFEKETGIAYDDMKTAFIDEKITESEAVKYRVEYGGAKQKDAEKTVSLWKFESENGWAYENRKSLYLDGEISAATLKKALIEFGEYDPEDADLQVQAYDWESEGYENVGTGMVDAYNKYCATLRVPRDVYLHIRRFSSQTENDIGSDGEPIRYSAVKKIMREINAQRGLSDAQKTAIARSFGWSERTIRKYKLW